MKKLVNESLEDILKPKSKSDLESEFNKYPYLKNVYDVYEDLKKLGINVSLRSNMYNSKIKEIVADNYILSYLPEEERQITYQKYGWGITPIEDGYLIIDNIDSNEAKKIFIDLINNGEKAEKKYLEKTYKSVNESSKDILKGKSENEILNNVKDLTPWRKVNKK